MHRPVACVLRMFLRFSETIALDEILELGRQGVEIRVFSPSDRTMGPFTRTSLSRARARVTYVRTWGLHSARNHSAGLRLVLAEPDSAAARTRAERARLERDFDLSRNFGRLRALLEEEVAA